MTDANTNKANRRGEDMERHSRTCGTRFGYRALTTTVSLLPPVLAAPAAWAQETQSTPLFKPAAEQPAAASQSGPYEIHATGTRTPPAGLSHPPPVPSLPADPPLITAPATP